MGPGASTDNVNKTGGGMTYEQAIASMGPVWTADNKRLEALKLAEVKNHSLVGDGTASIQATSVYLVTPQIGQGTVHAVDVWYDWTTKGKTSDMQQRAYLDSSPNSPKTSDYPVDSKNRRCTHCGAASALVVLRYLGAQGTGNASDLSADDGMAIFQLGVGWNNGAYDTTNWFIQYCCDGSQGSEYLNNNGQIAKVLDARTPKFTYVLSGKSAYTQADFTRDVQYDIDHGYPVVVGINTAYWPHYHNIQGGHVLVIDGYIVNNDGSIDFRMNDVNDCGFGSTAPAKYYEAAGTVYTAMTSWVW